MLVLVLIFQVRLQNRLVSAGLESVLSHIESCIASYYRQFSTNIKFNKNRKINTSFARPDLWLLGATKTDFNLLILYFSIQIFSFFSYNNSTYSSIIIKESLKAKLSTIRVDTSVNLGMLGMFYRFLTLHNDLFYNSVSHAIFVFTSRYCC